MKSFTWQRFMVRWAVALVLVFATFNPFGYSYYHWVTAVDGGSVPLMALAGVSLLIVYVIIYAGNIALPGAHWHRPCRGFIRRRSLGLRRLRAFEPRTVESADDSRSYFAGDSVGGWGFVVAHSPPDIGPGRYRRCR